LSRVEVAVVLTNGDGQAGQSMEPVTLFLAVTVSPNATFSPALSISAAGFKSTEVESSGSGEVTKPPVVQESTTTRSGVPASSEALSTPATPMLPAGDDRAAISSTEGALRGADEAMKTIDLSTAWEGALGRIKWVMDTLNPVSEVGMTPIILIPD